MGRSTLERQMNKLSVRARLTLVIGGMSLLAVAIATLSLIAIDRANDRLEDYVHGINARAEMAVDVRSAVNQRAIGARNLVLLSTPDEMKNEAARISLAHAEVSQKLQQLRSSAVSADVPAAVQRPFALQVEVTPKLKLHLSAFSWPLESNHAFRSGSEIASSNS